MPRTTLIADAEATFRSLFDRQPLRHGYAPGRVNLIGDHVDYEEGFVLPIAIDQAVAVAVGFASGMTSRIQSTAFTGSIDVSPDADPASTGWAAIILGLAQRLQVDRPINIAIHADLPIGAGLGSSAALGVAAARALSTLIEEPISDACLIALCRETEHACAGTPCGIMDMYTSVHGTLGTALMLDCRTEQADPVPLPPELAIITVDSGVRHELATSAYAERRAACRAAATALDVPMLRDATLQAIDAGSLGQAERHRATHVVLENARVQRAARALQERDFSTLGEQMFASHESLRDLFDVSCPELDAIVEDARALQRDGVWGARMTGGGFGGSVIVACDAARADDIAQRIGGRRVRTTE